MDSSKIQETVLNILNTSSNVGELTVTNIWKSVSQILNIADHDESTSKKLVREIVGSYVALAAPQEEEEEDDNNGKKDGKEYDDDGGLIICRLTKTRRVTVSDYKGQKLISIREYYINKKDGKECPSTKGISLTVEQWATLKKNFHAIEKAI